MNILHETGTKGKFKISEFKKMVREYIKTHKNSAELIHNDLGKIVIKERKILSICDFCCEYEIDSEDDFWLLMQHENREYARYGKILMTNIKAFAQKLIVNDKNANFAMLVGKTYFPDDKEGEVMAKPKKGKIEQSKDIDLADILKGSDKELLKALRESLSKPILSSQE